MGCRNNKNEKHTFCAPLRFSVVQADSLYDEIKKKKKKFLPNETSLKKKNLTAEGKKKTFQTSTSRPAVLLNGLSEKRSDVTEGGRTRRTPRSVFKPRHEGPRGLFPPICTNQEIIKPLPVESELTTRRVSSGGSEALGCSTRRHLHVAFMG